MFLFEVQTKLGIVHDKTECPIYLSFLFHVIYRSISVDLPLKLIMRPKLPLSKFTEHNQRPT